MSAKMQVMLSAPAVFGLRHVVKPLIRSKITKAEYMKQLQKDNKTLFGSLVETRKQKVAREKRERKGLVTKKSSVELPESKKAKEIDTEAYYILHSKERQHYSIKVSRIPVPSSTKKILFVDDQRRIIGKKETAKEPEAAPPVSESKEKTEGAAPEAEVKPAPNIIPLPSPILINQMVNFSYINANKDEEARAEASRILTISQYEDKSTLHIPSVTRILTKTMTEQSKLNLELWKQRMIGELGVEGFEIYSKELLLNGKQFHSSIQNYLTKSPFEVPAAVENSWKSVQHVLEKIEEIKAIETHAVHQKLRYRGIVDCVAVYRGNLCVIDWKKSDKPKTSIENTFDAPVQVASYVGALNSDSNYKFQVRNGIVVVGYTNGDPASVHEIDPNLMNKYWKLWVRRLQQYYWELTSSKQDSVGEDKK